MNPDPPLPDVGVDVGVPCYECSGNLCLANQSAAADCAFGDGRLGDLCEVHGSDVTGCGSGVPGITCLIVGAGGETVGFCTLPCTVNGECFPYGAVCGDFNGDGVGEFCVWICNDDSECPPGEFPFPDAGVAD